MVHLLTGEQTRLPSPEGDPIAFILSGDLLLTWSYDSSTIQSYRLGASDWSVTSFWDYNLQGVVCVNGTIYAMVSSYLSDSPVYRLAVVELSDDRRNSAELVFLGSLHTRTLELPVDTELLLYPAECHGELILIVAVEYNPRQYPRVFRAFKWKSGEDEWVRITSLGGCALFFSDSDFVGFLGPDHPGIQKDCIYFNKKGLWSEYSSVDGSFRQSDAVCSEGKLLDTFREESVWVFPSMY